MIVPVLGGTSKVSAKSLSMSGTAARQSYVGLTGLGQSLGVKYFY